ncbi:1582_t:CDS:1, partial [Racocetra fulgida]
IPLFGVTNPILRCLEMMVAVVFDVYLMKYDSIVLYQLLNQVKE